jgi:hypothetical protein
MKDSLGDVPQKWSLINKYSICLCYPLPRVPNNTYLDHCNFLLF